MFLFSKSTYNAILFHQVLKIKSVKWDPLLSTHCRRRSRKLSLTRRVISCGMAVISWRIASLSCSIDWGRLLYTFDLRYPQRKKSHGFKSGERAGQLMLPHNEIKWTGNIFLKIPIVRRGVYYMKTKWHYMYFSKMKTLFCFFTLFVFY